MMMLRWVFVGVWLGVWACLCDGKPNGAPHAACKTMTPEHNTICQDVSTNPYRLTVTKVGPGFKVVLGGKLPFRGFFIQARRDPHAYQTLGQFSPVANGLGKQEQCLTTNDAVTHRDPADKFNITTTWSPPAGQDITGVKFYASIVQKFSLFWCEIASAALKCS